jgi:hypothetical protein
MDDLDKNYDGMIDKAEFDNFLENEFGKQLDNLKAMFKEMK